MYIIYTVYYYIHSVYIIETVDYNVYLHSEYALIYTEHICFHM